MHIFHLFLYVLFRSNLTFVILPLHRKKQINKKWCSRIVCGLPFPVYIQHINKDSGAVLDVLNLNVKLDVRFVI